MTSNQGTHSQGNTAETKGTLLAGTQAHSYLSIFLIHPRSTFIGDGAVYGGWDPPISTISQDNPQQKCPLANLISKPLNWDFPSLVTPSCEKLTVQAMWETSLRIYLNTMGEY